MLTVVTLYREPREVNGGCPVSVSYETLQVAQLVQHIYMCFEWKFERCRSHMATTGVQHVATTVVGCLLLGYE